MTYTEIKIHSIKPKGYFMCNPNKVVYALDCEFTYKRRKN